jgi:hypothetical protein
MKTATAVALLLFWATPILAANRANVSPQELAKAINQADSGSAPYRQGSSSPRDIRSVRCLGPDEEPTEFECRWLQHTKRGWTRRRTWLAIGGAGWRVID